MRDSGATESPWQSQPGNSASAEFNFLWLYPAHPRPTPGPTPGLLGLPPARGLLAGVAAGRAGASGHQIQPARCAIVPAPGPSHPAMLARRAPQRGP